MKVWGHWFLRFTCSKFCNGCIMPTYTSAHQLQIHPFQSSKILADLHYPNNMEPFFFNNEEICKHHYCNQWLELNTIETVMSLSWILPLLKISPWSFRCTASGSHCFRKICESIRVYWVPWTSELFLLLQSHVYFLSSILRQYKDRLP